MLKISVLGGYCCFFITIYCTILQAQDTPLHTKIDQSCTFCVSGDHQEDPPYPKFTFRSEMPYMTSALGVFSIGVLSNYLFGHEAYSVQELGMLDKSTIFKLDRFTTTLWSPKAARASDYLRTGVAVLPAFFLINHHTRHDILPLLVMGSEVAVLTLGLTIFTKNIALRDRPFLYNPDPDIPFELKDNPTTRFSFFSGHTAITSALSFFFAKVMNDYHPSATRGFKIVTWSIATVIPAATATLRVRAGKHFPTDVLAGYMVGGAIGFLVPHFHGKSQNRRLLKEQSLQFYPTGNGLGMTLHF